MVFYWFCTPFPILRLCIALLAVAEGLLLLDIGGFVIYVQFDGMVYEQIAGIPMGTNCALLIVDLFFYCYERDFMSDLHKSKRHDLIDMFNDTS